MTTPVKLTLAALIITGGIIGYKYVRELFQAFTFRIVRYGIPNYSNFNLTVPITIEFSNPTKLTIRPDHVLVELYLKSQGQWVQVGDVNQTVTVPPGKSQSTIIPVLNMQALISSVNANFAQMLTSARLDIKTDVTITYQGITFRKHSYEDTVTYPF
jgi:DNA-directed RNA polymerase alpha subunit